MRRISTILAAAAVALSAGCSADQAVQLTQTYKDARVSGRSASASSMAGSAMAAQSALYHIASALSAQVSKQADSNKWRVLDADGPSYAVDLDAGTGAVTVVRGGRKVVDLTFKVEKESLDQGMRYRVANLRGTTEGFQVLLPRLSLVYSAALDPAGNMKKDDKGNTVFKVAVDTTGFLGVDNQPVFQIAGMTFNVEYPFPTTETKVGGIKLYGTDGLVFDGEAYLNGQAVSAKGQVSDAAGAKLYNFSVGADGKVAMTPAQ